jgi:hypothetical protein
MFARPLPVVAVPDRDKRVPHVRQSVRGTKKTGEAPPESLLDRLSLDSSFISVLSDQDPY